MNAMFFGVKRVHLRVVAITRELLAGIVLTPARFDMMRIIKLHGRDGVLQAKIRDLLGVSAATVSVMLRSLELLGFVRRRPFERDARQVLVTITEVGSTELQVAIDRLIASGIAERIAESAFSKTEDEGARDVGVVRRYLRTIRRNYADPAVFEHPWSTQQFFDVIEDTFLPALFRREKELKEDIDTDRED